MASSFPSHRDHSGNDTGECFRMSALRRLPPANTPLQVLQRPRGHPLRPAPPLHMPCRHHSDRLKRSRQSRTGTSSPPVRQLQLKMDIPQLGERRQRPQTPKHPAPFHNIARLVGFLVRHSPALPEVHIQDAMGSRKQETHVPLNVSHPVFLISPELPKSIKTHRPSGPRTTFSSFTSR